MKVKTKGNVKHNGKWYKDGETISTIKKEDAERLIELGVASEVAIEQDSKEESKPTNSKPSNTDKPEDTKKDKAE